MPARQVALDDRDGEARVRRIADQRLVELRDVGGAIGDLAAALHLPRVGLGREIQRAVGLAGNAGVAVSREADRRGLGAHEPAHDEREIAQRLRRGEDVDLAIERRVLARQDPGKAGVELAAGDAVQRRRHREAQPRRRVVAHSGLRVPEAAAAVEIARLGGDHQRHIVARRLAVAEQRQRLAVGRLRLEPPGVGDGQVQLAVAPQRLRQVHHQGVLVLDPDAEQPAELIALDRLDDERVGEPERQRAEHERPHLETDLRAPLDPLALRRRAQVDVVVEDVVVGEVVFVEERAALRQLELRRVDRDVVMAPAVEQRDVFRLGARPRVGQRVEAAGVHLGEEVAAARQQRPRLAAEIAEVDDERFRRLLLEDLLRALQGTGVHRHRLQRRRREERLEVAGVDAQVGGVEARLQRVAAAEDSDLSFFRRRRRMEVDRALAEQDEGGDAAFDLGDEHRSFGQRQLEILGRDLEIARRELLRGVE